VTSVTTVANSACSNLGLQRWFSRRPTSPPLQIRRTRPPVQGPRSTMMILGLLSDHAAPPRHERRHGLAPTSLVPLWPSRTAAWEHPPESPRASTFSRRPRPTAKGRSSRPIRHRPAPQADARTVGIRTGRRFVDVYDELDAPHPTARWAPPQPARRGRQAYGPAGRPSLTCAGSTPAPAPLRLAV